MSKVSRILVGIMVAALIYMGAVRLYQFYEQQVQLQQQRAEEEEQYSFMRVAQEDPFLPPTTAWQPPQEDVFIEQKPLSQVLQEEQAKETIESILNDYRMNPAFRKFNEDLKRATEGRVQSFDELSNQGLAQIITQHPEISEVVRKNLQKEDFAQIVEQIFSNPQFQQSVQTLQKKKDTRWIFF